MKKNIFKILFSILLIFIYMCTLYADGELSCSESQFLSEYSMYEPTHITATMPICGTKTLVDYAEVSVGSGVGVPEGGVQDFGDLEWVEGIGDYYDWYTVTAGDNKGTIPVYMPICSDSNSKVRGRMTCTYTKVEDADSK